MIFFSRKKKTDSLPKRRPILRSAAAGFQGLFSHLRKLGASRFIIRRLQKLNFRRLLRLGLICYMGWYALSFAVFSLTAPWFVGREIADYESRFQLQNPRYEKSRLLFFPFMALEIQDLQFEMLQRNYFATASVPRLRLQLSLWRLLTTASPVEHIRLAGADIVVSVRKEAAGRPQENFLEGENLKALLGFELEGSQLSFQEGKKIYTFSDMSGIFKPSDTSFIFETAGIFSKLPLHVLFESRIKGGEVLDGRYQLDIGSTDTHFEGDFRYGAPLDNSLAALKQKTPTSAASKGGPSARTATDKVLSFEGRFDLKSWGAFLAGLNDLAVIPSAANAPLEGEYKGFWGGRQIVFQTLETSAAAGSLTWNFQENRSNGKLSLDFESFCWDCLLRSRSYLIDSWTEGAFQPVVRKLYPADKKFAPSLIPTGGGMHRKVPFLLPDGFSLSLDFKAQKGRLLDQEVGPASFQALLQKGTLHLEDMRLQVPGGVFKTSGSLVGGVSVEGLGTGTFEISRPDLFWRWAYLPLISGLFETSPKDRLTARYRFDDASLKLEDMTLKGPHVDWAGTFSYGLTTAPEDAWSLFAQTSRMHIGAEALAAAAKTYGLPPLLRTKNGRIHITVQEGYLGEAFFDSLSLEASLSPQELKLEKLLVNNKAFLMSLSGQIGEPFETQGRFDLKAHMEAAEITEMLHQMGFLLPKSWQSLGGIKGDLILEGPKQKAIVEGRIEGLQSFLGFQGALYAQADQGVRLHLYTADYAALLQKFSLGTPRGDFGAHSVDLRGFAHYDPQKGFVLESISGYLGVMPLSLEGRIFQKESRPQILLNSRLRRGSFDHFVPVEKAPSPLVAFCPSSWDMDFSLQAESFSFKGIPLDRFSFRQQVERDLCRLKIEGQIAEGTVEAASRFRLSGADQARLRPVAWAPWYRRRAERTPPKPEASMEVLVKDVPLVSLWPQAAFESRLQLKGSFQRNEEDAATPWPIQWAGHGSIELSDFRLMDVKARPGDKAARLKQALLEKTGSLQGYYAYGKDIFSLRQTHLRMNRVVSQLSGDIRLRNRLLSLRGTLEPQMSLFGLFDPRQESFDLVVDGSLEAPGVRIEAPRSDSVP